MGKCVICGSALIGRQRKFCSRNCKNRDTNQAHQSYRAQQQRGRERKLRLVVIKGNRCARCGYHSNYAALEFHHRDAGTKAFQLDLRSLSNRRWCEVLKEAEKCMLLCSNCHAEVHNPECRLELDRRS